ncbi:protein kinase [Streptomyces sp. 900105755]
MKVMAEKWVHRPDLRERFLDEARLLRQAASDRVVQVYDIGELPDGRPYFVMTCADGGTLADRVAQGPLAVDQALRFAVQAARGVADLHAVGIVICTSVPTATSAWSTRARPSGRPVPSTEPSPGVAFIALGWSTSRPGGGVAVRRHPPAHEERGCGHGGKQS